MTTSSAPSSNSSGSSTAMQPADSQPAGRAQLVRAALRVAGAHGAKAATVRRIAAEAGVTPGLVVHHFGTKQRLLAEVDSVVATRFTDAMTVPDQLRDADTAMREIAAGLASVIGGDPDLRRYVRRSILEASPAGAAVFGHLVDLTTGLLRRFRGAATAGAGPDLAWLAVQTVTINLAGVLFEPLLEPVLGRDPFAPDEVARRTAANLRFIAAGLA